jgi:hypothetical protein
MKHRPLLLILLLVFRVFVVPVGYALHSDEIANVSDAFEHFRLKKRRSSYLDDAGHTCEISVFTLIISCAASRKKKAAVRHNDDILTALTQWSAPILALFFPTRFIATGPLYLRNRVLRI